MLSKSIWPRLPPQVGVGRARKWSSALRRNSRIHSRLGLVLGDVADDLLGEALRRLVGVAGLGIVEAEPLRVVGADVLERALLGQLLGGRCGTCVSGVAIETQTSSFTSPSSTRASNVSTGWKAGRVFGPAGAQVEQRAVPRDTQLYRRPSRTPPRRVARRRASTDPRSRRARRPRSGRRRSSARRPRPGASRPRGAPRACRPSIVSAIVRFVTLFLVPRSEF